MGVNVSRENKIKEPAEEGPEIAPSQPAVADNAPQPHFTYLSGDRPGIKPRVRDGRRNFKIKAIVSAACFAGLLFVCAQVKYKFFIPDLSGSNPVSGLVKQKPGMLNNSRQKALRADQAADTQPQHPAISDEQARQAVAYADSAKACASVNGSIAFYKMAISFNKRNIDAWYGLINALTLAQMPEDARTARMEMGKIFGEGALSLAQIVERFGDLLDLYLSEDGTYRIEYRSRQTGQTELLRETFLLVKAFGVQCDCAALSLYAHTDKNKGVLVYLKTDRVPASYAGFIAQANVTYLK
jgi:hypothetical protein